MAMYQDGEITQPKLVCSGTVEPIISFEGFGDHVKVVITGAGEALISRNEIAALAALFPVPPQPKEDRFWAR